MIRFLDVCFSSIGLILLSPFLIIIGLLIKMTSKGPVFFRQERVGKGEKAFLLIKFRSMKVGASKKGLLTVGKDDRITRIGHFLRKYKLDELPQLINVLKGDMSIVGPRPEVSKYTQIYSPEQKKMLSVKPGITDPASIFYKDESSVLANSANPEQTYIDIVLPHKLSISRKYALNPTVGKYLKYIVLTVLAIFLGRE